MNVAHTAAVERKSDAGLALSKATLPALGRAFEEGRLTAERLVQVCLDRIEAYDRRGPRINAVINLNPEALQRARDLDRERERRGPRGPLHGIPVVVKDTIDVAGMPTTGGFTALAESHPLRDAATIRRLHDAGAVMLAKVNANDWFGQAPMSASTLGGQTLNPHHLDYVPGGSSCGTGAALAANYAPLGLGTDASGSVLMPAADSGVLGLIPSRGLVSRAGSMCMAPTIGRLGIMARSAFDLAALLSFLTGWDSEDMTTNEALERFPRQPYQEQLAGAGLGAFRIGVLREMWRDEPRHGEGLDIMDRLLGLLRREGAILVDPVLTGIDLQDVATLETGQSSATSYELIPALNAYFARLGPDAPYRTVEKLIASAGVDRLKGRFREALSLPPPEQSDYYLARLQAQAMLRDALIDVLGRHRLDALLLPYSLVGASRVGERRVDGTNSLASHAGLPSVVVPAGHTAAGLPIAAQLIAQPFAETTLLRLAHLLDRAAGAVKLPAATPPLPGEEL